MIGRLLLVLGLLSAGIASARVVCPAGNTTTTLCPVCPTTTSTSTSTTVVTTSSTTSTSTSTTLVPPTGEFFVDSTAGADTNDGHSRATAWRTWGRMLDACNDGTIVAGNTILYRPGRYRVADATNATFRMDHGCVGTSIDPITIAGDPFYGAGVVEISGSTVGNLTGRAGPWLPAKKCSVSGSVNPGVPCLTALTCGGTGTCDTVTGVYYSTYLSPSTSATFTPGVAFQPGATPGADPILFDILWTPESVPVQMPTFTAGRNEVWPYSEEPAVDSSYCLGSHSPWACCTGAGTQSGCVNDHRVYVQTASGVAPDAVSPQVEFPWNHVLVVGQSASANWPQYVHFTNHLCVGGTQVDRACEADSDCGGGGTCTDTGHRWSWRWGMQQLIRLNESSHFRFADGEIAYTSAAVAKKGLLPASRVSGSGFPRDGGGPQYLVVSGGSAVTHQCDHHEYRRLNVHASLDEIFHLGPVNTLIASGCTAVTDCTAPGLTALACTAGVCTYYDENNFGGALLEDVEFHDSPMNRANGTSVYPSGAAYSWPPPGYAGGWAVNYQGFYDPMGGGGQTPTGIITNIPNTTVRRANVHDLDGILLSWEANSAGYPYGGVLEYSTIDGAGRHGCGGASAVPPSATSACNPSSPGGNCGGFTSSTNLRFMYGNAQAVVPGFDVDYNLFTNIKGMLFREDGTSAKTPIDGMRWENNTFDLEGEYLTYAPCQGDAFAPGTGVAMTGHPFVFENNNVQQGVATTHKVFNINTTLTGAGLSVIDHNVWKNANQRWTWGGSAVITSFATWQSTSSQDANSISADPLFVNSATDFHIQNGSPAIDRGVDLGFTHDLDNVAVPQNVSPCSGCYEVLGTTTTVASTTTSTSTSTVVTTTTSTSTTTTTLVTTVQELIGGGTAVQSNSATNFAPISGFGPWNATENQVEGVVSAPGILGGLRAVVGTVPGGSGQWDITVEKNGAATTLTCAITSAATTCQDATQAHNVTFAAGDRIGVKAVPTNTPASAGIRFSTLWQPTTSDETLWPSTPMTTVNNTTAWWTPLSGYLDTTTELSAKGITPIAGTAKQLYAWCSANATAGTSRTLTLRVNGADTALTCTIGAGAATCNDTSDTVALAAHDLVNIQYTASGSPGGAGCAVGLTFVPTTTTQFVLGMASSLSQTPTTGTDKYQSLSDTRAALVTTEDQLVQRAVQAATVKAIAVAINTPLTSTSSLDFTLRKNAGSTALTCNITGASATTCSAATDVTVADDDLVNTALHHSGAGGVTVNTSIGYSAIFTGTFP